MNAMLMNMEKVSVTVPAGTYFLGDPCYVVPNEDWMPLLESCHYFGLSEEDLPGPRSPIGTLPNGMQVLAFHTAYGDGIYTGSDGVEYGVDAGMIGLVPKEAWDAHVEADIPSLGSEVTFEEPTACTNDGGTMTFGSIKIETKDDPDDDPDEGDDGWMV